MEALADLAGGFSTALSPINLVWVVVGALLGTAVGVLPGLGSAMAVALLLPVTFALDPTGALIMFAGIYYGGLFGDSTTGILLNTPGNSSAIASTFEGHRMALAGRAPQALATSAIGAFTGGLVATSVVALGAPLFASLASAFGPEEFFALTAFAFVATSFVVADSALKGLAALVIGFAVGVVGIDSQTGTVRYTLGLPQLFDGIGIVVITVGLLALGEVLYIASRGRWQSGDKLVRVTGRPYLSRAEVKEAAPAWLRGTAFGVPFGVIPVGGSEVPTFLAYGTERRLDARRADPQFGKGAIRGLAAPEAAGNATAGTAMGALLAIGLPTSATAAVMLTALQQFGFQTGPLLFSRSGDLVWALIASLFIGLFVLLIINLPFAPVWAKLLLIPRPYLYAGISVFAGLGIYAASGSVFDLGLLLGLGLLGFLMRRHDIPLAPVLIAVILGPLAEVNLRNSLAISQGDLTVLFSSGTTRVIYGLLLVAVVVAVVNKVRARGSADV
ncbi:tripartite tricarboxylate transporter permease [Pseudokineococcus lusitanus]|uniref:Putative tricarboxylic transport membrane protein n=1 Tax=Pseudokineococcus lusitanus TaxID=763993 RepID=A0A3N1GWL6_9ACTN|nr:tripartite tricarboxylate transporter permease [Pseudokineococcus lusitanus]ROP34650.1 putative tricarboxylic transport membrane protein [Pseudokineococcus lusitanus]